MTPIISTLALGLAIGLSHNALAAILVYDPADTIDPADWAADNDIYADYTAAFHSSQPSEIQGRYVFNENSTVMDHEDFSTDKNDTSVILVTDGAGLDLSYSKIEKWGYYSNLNDASFWGYNAAINVANTSLVNLDHVNITVHNGAANVYSYGTGTVVTIANSWLYSSGPASHGIYASGNGTAYVENVKGFSGGMRSSIYSGDSPAGYIHVRDSTGHTQGVGSACFYALGLIDAENVECDTEKAPTLFMDSDQNATLVGVSARAGMLASTVMFSSATRMEGAVLNLVDTRLESTGDDMPGLWFGNVVAQATIVGSDIVTKSGVLVVANTSQVTQEFDHFAGYEENASIQPAIVDVWVGESVLRGDLAAYNGSVVNWNLGNYSTWLGKAYYGYGTAGFNVTLDRTASWNLTGDTEVQVFWDEDCTLGNVYGGGFNIMYNQSAEGNAWLGGSTKELGGGGSLMPY
ncbi:hypothetical protein MKZ38_005439 [Zalerion maritima]|uniref:Uncharacterized protein n=1 Tax=Zalerion maritima TaxID=339359 RepID=A0AAD5WNZ7_9PEZI|nr:hypothetical protein MKZ38_005439 [Zalerion maritima]